MILFQIKFFPILLKLSQIHLFFILILRIVLVLLLLILFRIHFLLFLTSHLHQLLLLSLWKILVLLGNPLELLDLLLTYKTIIVSWLSLLPQSLHLVHQLLLLPQLCLILLHLPSLTKIYPILIGNMP
jgi:hypothetical protein